MRFGIDARTLMDVRYSGVSEYTYNLLKEMLRQDFANSFALFYNSGRDISGRLPVFRHPHLEIHHTRYPNKLFNYGMQKIFKQPKIDRLMRSDLFFMPHLNHIALSGPCPKVITVHDLSFLRYPRYFSWRKNVWHYLLHVKKLLSRFDMIVTISENSKQDIIELTGQREERIKVIYSGIGEEFRMIDKHREGETFEKIRRKYRMPERFIFSLSTLEPRKNLAGLIRAYEELRREAPESGEYKLVIGGERGWKYREIIKTWQTSKFRDDIIMAGYIEPADKAYVYNLAEVFVYPSFYEGFGFPPLEAMACGCPVITSTASSLPEVVQNSGLLVDPNNISEIAAAIGSLISDSGLRRELVLSGLKQAGKFNWPQTVRQYLELFSKFK